MNFTKKINCPICNDQETEKFWVENSYIGNKCTNCNTVFIANKPTKDELANYYNHKSEGDLSINKSTPMKEKVSDYTFKKILNYKKSGNLVEFGPGYGVFLSMAKKHGFTTSGIEINKDQINYLKKELKVHIYEGLIEDEIKNLPDKHFDIVFSWDVLSHLYFPKNVFKESERILKNDGLLVFETGNFGKISKFWYNLLKSVSYPEHLFFFSQNSISKILAGSNFEIIKKFRISTALLIILESFKKDKKSVNPKNISSKNRKKSLIKKLVINIIFYFSLFLGKIQPRCFPAKEIYIALKKNND